MLPSMNMMLEAQASGQPMSPPDIKGPLGFGCVGLTTVATARRVETLLETAFNEGITHFDTAPIYGRGYSERLLAGFIRQRRERVTVATKVGLPLPRRSLVPPWLALPAYNAYRRFRREDRRTDDANTEPDDEPAASSSPRLSRSFIETSFDHSRRALNTDYVDLFLLHEHMPDELTVDGRDYLLWLKEQGKVRQIGVAANYKRLLRYAPDQLAAWDVLQYEFGSAWPESRVIMARFPGHRHIFHSALAQAIGDQPRVTVSEALTACIGANPGGLTLFSSTKPHHVVSNARSAT